MVCIIDRCNSFVLVCHFVEKNGLIRLALWSRGRMLDWSARLMPKAAKKQKASCLLPWLGAKISNWQVGPPMVLWLYIYEGEVSKSCVEDWRNLTVSPSLSLSCPISATTQKPWEGSPHPLFTSFRSKIRARTEHEWIWEAQVIKVCVDSNSIVWFYLELVIQEPNNGTRAT